MTKIPEIITRIKDTMPEISEYNAKTLHAATNCNRNHRAIIPVIVNIPDAATKIKCIFPLRVFISPPASRGKKRATSIPKIELIKNKIETRLQT